jgi:hypothetical protein
LAQKLYNRRILQTIGQVSLWVFAFIGFVAASIQIAEYLTTPDNRLVVQVTPQKYANPSFVHLAFGTLTADSPLGSMAMKLQEAKCDQKPTKTLADVTVGSLDKLNCDQAKDFKQAVDFLTSDDIIPGILSELSIKNAGSSPASNIRLTGEGINHVELVISIRDRQTISANANVYSLPSLNPGDEMTVYVWGDEMMRLNGSPKVTYAGGVVDSTILSPTAPDPKNLLMFLAQRLTIFGKILLLWFIIVFAIILACTYEWFARERRKSADTEI